MNERTKEEREEKEEKEAKEVIDGTEFLMFGGPPG